MPKYVGCSSSNFDGDPINGADECICPVCGGRSYIFWDIGRRKYSTESVGIYYFKCVACGSRSDERYTEEEVKTSNPRWNKIKED